MCRVRFTSEEKQQLAAECRKLPPAKMDYSVADPIQNCMMAVLDFQMQGPTVSKAIAYFNESAKDSLGIMNLTTLNTYLYAQPDNNAAAVALWNMRHWRRVDLLRGLVSMFLEYKAFKKIEDDCEAVRAWASEADFHRDFQGRIRSGRFGLGYKVFTFTQQRVGVETTVPDIWTHRFVVRATGKDTCDWCLVQLLNEVADSLGVSRRSLDWAIWEHERSGT